MIVALLSHQLRDGMRLGLWFWPLGSTPPIQYLLYLLAEEALPFVMARWQNRVQESHPAAQEFESIAQHPEDEDDELRTITIEGSDSE